MEGSSRPDGLLDKKTEKLLGFLLLLLADADLEVENLGFLVGLVVVTSHGVSQVFVHIRVLGKDCHYSEIFIARRAEGTKALDVRNSHNFTSLAFGECNFGRGGRRASE